MLYKNCMLSPIIKSDKFDVLKVIDKSLCAPDPKSMDSEISYSNFVCNNLKLSAIDTSLPPNLSTNNSFRHEFVVLKSKQHILTRLAKYAAFSTMTITSICTASHGLLLSPRHQGSERIGSHASSSTLPLLREGLIKHQNPEFKTDNKIILPVNLFIMFSVISICNVDSWINLFLIGIISLHEIKKQWQDQDNRLFYILDNIIGILAPLILDAYNFGLYLPLAISLAITIACYLLCTGFGKTKFDWKDLLSNVVMFIIILLYNQFLLKLSFIVKFKQYFASLYPNSIVFPIFSYILKFIISTIPYLLLYWLNTKIGNNKNRIAPLYAPIISAAALMDILFKTNFIILLTIIFIFNAESFSIIEALKPMMPKSNFFEAL